MQSDSYQAFTDELTERLSGDERVVGLVALGSMSRRDYEPDEWSDHDFFVVTRAGHQETLRRETDWLPHAGEIVLAFRETPHGLKVLYGDGHLLEYAVFDVEELGLASVNRYRVLLDRGGIEERMREVARPSGSPSSPRRDAHFHFGLLVANVLVGAGRSLRGERLSGAFFVKGTALRAFVELVELTLPSERSGILDDLDPLRRFELVYPGIARELDALTRADILDAALGLLDLAERELSPTLPELPWRALEIVRERLRNGRPSRKA